MATKMRLLPSPLDLEGEPHFEMIASVLDDRFSAVRLHGENGFVTFLVQDADPHKIERGVEAWNAVMLDRVVTIGAPALLEPVEAA